MPNETETSPATPAPAPRMLSTGPQLKDIGKMVKDEFLAKLSDMNFTAVQLLIIQRASDTIAKAALFTPLYDPDAAAEMALQRDMALATLGNLVVGENLHVVNTMRDAAYSVVTRLISSAIGLAISVIP